MRHHHSEHSSELGRVVIHRCKCGRRVGYDGDAVAGVKDKFNFGKCVDNILKLNLIRIVKQFA